MATTYGIISDVHHTEPKIFHIAMRVLKDLGANKLVLNGDLVGDQSGYPSEVYFFSVLTAAVNSGLETYVQGGSDKEVDMFQTVFSHMSRKYPNLVDTFNNRKIGSKDHDLVFLPGSDWEEGYPDYKLVSKETVTENLRDISDPEKTIVFCHSPPYFDSIEYGIDKAIFGQADEQFKLGVQSICRGSVFPGHMGAHLKRYNFPVSLKQENRGSKELRLIYEELGITKAISGHFHESAHRAHDFHAQPIKEDSSTTELFWNASHLDEALVGLLEVDGPRVRYHNINLVDRVN